MNESTQTQPAGFICAHPSWTGTSRQGTPVLNISRCGLCRKKADAKDIRVWEKRQLQGAGR